MLRWARIVLGIVGLLGLPVVSLAASPHFVQESASVSSSGDLACHFKVAGLGDSESILMTCSADAVANYACFNKGGNHPQASNKEAVAGPVSGSDTFTSGKNGAVVGDLALHPPPTTLDCPGNQVVRLCDVTYTTVALSADPASGPAFDADVPGTFDRVLLSCF